MIRHLVATGVLAHSAAWAQMSPLPDSPPGRAMERFIAAFNTGRFDSLAAFIAAHPGFRTSGPARFVEAFREYGAVDAVWVESSTERRIMAWTRGRVSRAGLGFLLQVQADRPDRIEFLGIDRRDLPPAAIRAPVSPSDDHLSTLVSQWAGANRDGPFSGVVAIARGGRPVIRVAVGRRSPQGARVDLGDSFLIASVTKLITGVLIGRLHETGLVSWDGEIAPWVPELPARRVSGVTVSHLLTHRSGLEFDDDSIFSREMRTVRSLEAMVEAQSRALARIKADSVLGPLREPDYSNEGYVLLGLIAQRSANLPLATLLRREVTGRIPMGRTEFFDPARTPPAFATPWTGRRERDGQAIDGPLRPAVPTGLGGPAGGLVSSADDLLELGNTLLRGRLLGAATWETMVTNGYGIVADRDGDQLRRIGHSGNSFGVSAEFWMYPQTGHVLVVLANREGVAKAAASYFNELIAP